MALKISLLGAGSVVFAKTLISDVLQFPELSNATIALMDIDPARLKIAKIMAERIIAKLGVGAKVEATLDQREAIRDANYVIVTVQVGGYEPGTVIDFEIPRKYGLLQTIGDTLGIGGIFRALRTIPVINSFARDIAEVGAANCLLLNYTNPMAMNCWAVDRAVGIPHVGLCHSVQGTSQMLASFAKLPFHDVSFLVAGINHMAFFLRFEYKRQDAYPLLFGLLEDASFGSEKVRFEMMRRTGYFVTESSEHQSEYTPYFIHHGEELINRFDIPIDEYLRRCKSIMGTWKSTEATLLGEESEIVVAPQSHEYGSYIIHSRETNTARVVYGNVPNRGLITNLPQGCCVELPCLVNAVGLQPTYVGALPPQLAAMCVTNINVQSLTVEAALTRKREHIYHAAMLDPHTAATLPLDKIWSLCDDLIEAHQKAGLLGKFEATVPGTGRALAGTGDRILAKIEPAPGSHLDENSTELSLQVRVENPRAESVKVPLSVRFPEAGAEVVGDGDFEIDVPAGQTVSHPFKVRRSANGAHANGNGAPANGNGHVNGNGNGNVDGGHAHAPVPVFSIDLDSGTSGVFTRGLELQPRRVLDAGGEDPATFAIALSGFPAASGTLSMEDELLVFMCSVDDSKVKPMPGTAMDGSRIALFFDAEDGSGIRRLFLTPRPVADGSSEGTVELIGESLLTDGIHATYGGRPAGYEIRATIPFANAGMTARTSSFLFDVLVGINALGDAHSGGRAGLNGSLDSGHTSDHYARVRCSPATVDV